MPLVHDHAAQAAELLREICVSEHERERLRRGDQRVGQLFTEPCAECGRGVACAGFCLEMWGE